MTSRGHLMSITRNGINRVDHGVWQRATFEETVEILFDAAAMAESNTLKGVSENILMGQQCPFGTGMFDLILDEKMLMETIEVRGDENVKKPSAGYGNDSSSTTDSDIDPEEPWILDDSGQTPKVNIGSMTPIMGGVGNQSTPTTNGGFATPKMTDNDSGVEWSPEPMLDTKSPMVFQGYGTEGGMSGSGSSGNEDSPIYSPGSDDGGDNSPVYSPTSPQYSPTSPAYSPTSPAVCKNRSHEKIKSKSNIKFFITPPTVFAN